MNTSNELKERLKQIPILDVCKQVLNITPVLRANTYWCKCRPDERTASTRLYVDENRFHDYGTNTGGDNIKLVEYTMGVNFVTAMQMMKDAFHIEDPKNHSSASRYDLGDWEYEYIGLYGDRATKNFSFDVERMPMERIKKISEKYSMPMNELRVKHPKTYKRILVEKALPYVRSLRNNYLMAVWNYWQFCSNHVTPEHFYTGNTKNFLAEELKPLEQAERALQKAVHNTDISLAPAQDYDPVKVLEKLLEGEVKPSLGKLTYPEMQAEAEAKGCKVKYRTVDYERFSPVGTLEKYPYTAFLKAGKVVIGYLETDHAALKPALDAMRPLKKQAAPRKAIYVPPVRHTATGKAPSHKNDIER